MRIDGGHRRVDDLNGLVWMAGLKNSFELPGKAIGRIRIAHGRRLAEHENADCCAGRFPGGQEQGPGGARDCRRKEPPAELGIVGEHGAVALTRVEEKRRGIAVSGEAKSQFQKAQKQQWRCEGREPEPPASGRRYGGFGQTLGFGSCLARFATRGELGLVPLGFHTLNWIGHLPAGRGISGHALAIEESSGKLVAKS